MGGASVERGAVREKSIPLRERNGTTGVQGALRPEDHASAI